MDVNALLPEFEAVLDPLYVKAYKATVGMASCKSGWLSPADVQDQSVGY